MADEIKAWLTSDEALRIVCINYAAQFARRASGAQALRMPDGEAVEVYGEHARETLATLADALPSSPSPTDDRVQIAVDLEDAHGLLSMLNSALHHGAPADRYDRLYGTVQAAIDRYETSPDPSPSTAGDGSDATLEREQVSGEEAVFCGDCCAPSRPNCETFGHGLVTLGDLMTTYYEPTQPPSSPSVTHEEWRVVCEDGRVWNKGFQMDESVARRMADLLSKEFGPRRAQRRTVTESDWVDVPAPEGSATWASAQFRSQGSRRERVEGGEDADA